MTIIVSVDLVDAVGVPAAGGGAWNVVVSNNGAVLQETGWAGYTGAKPVAMLDNGLHSFGPWTHMNLSFKPNLYAPAAVTLNPTPTGDYRDDTLTTVKTLNQTAVYIQMPLLRLREPEGVIPPSQPHPGDRLAGPWLQLPPGQAIPLYHEICATDWMANLSNLTTLFDSNPTTGPFALPDNDGWDRFNNRVKSFQPLKAGAAMVLEYGEVGANGSGGPRFLVGLWAPARLTTNTPTWRDVITFIHPSTEKTWYPPVAYPFRAPYPYGVGDNTNAPSNNPDRTWQPYVNLALRYLVGELAPYRLDGNEAVMISPVFPHPGSSPSEQELYGLPFRTPAGLARLVAEVNLYLHRLHYGLSGFTFDRWWGKARATPTLYNSFAMVKPPDLRRAAVAAYSSSTAQLDPLLTGQPLIRYAANVWGAPDPVVKAFNDAWLETWCLDLLADSTTVPAATFEQHLKDWVNAKSERTYIMGGSGTTGHNDPDTHYPQLSKASASNVPVQSPTVANRHGRLWRGPSGKWKAIFCTNEYLNGTTADTKHWPPFPVAPNSDNAHHFMFRLTSGIAVQETKVGVP